jgi:hypothetical protein
MAITKTIEIDVIAPNAQQNINAVTTSLNNASKSSDNLNNTLNTDKGGNKFTGLKDSIGGLIPGFDKASNGASAFNKQLLVLLANPIGLVIAGIVLALTALFKAFQSSDEGADKLEQVMAGLSATLVVVRDRVLKVGGAIVKFFSGDFKGALKDGKDAVSGFGDDVVNEFKKASEATKLLQEVEDGMVSLGVQRAKLNKNLAESKELLTDENATYAQKKKAIEDLRKGEGKFTDDAIGFAKKRLLAAQLEKKLSTDERTKAIAEAQTALIDLETESANIKRSANKQQKQLEKERVSNQQEAINAQKTALKEAQDAEKAIIDEKLKDSQLSFQQQRDLVNNDNKLAIKDKKEFLKKINEEESKSIEEHNKAIADLNKKYDDEKANRLADTAVKKEELEYSRQLKEIENIAKTETEKNTLIEKLDAEHKVRMGIAAKTDAEKTAADQKIIDDKKIADEKTVADAKLAIQQGALDALGGLVDLAKSIGEKNKGIQRAGLVAESAVGIAKIILNTQTANAVALASPINALDPTYGTRTSLINKISAAIGIAANIAATAKGLSALGGGGAASGGGSNPAGGGGSSAPQFNIVGQSSTNQLSQTIANQQKQPIKTYVVAGDVTTQQSLDRNAVQTSTFGG